MRRGMEWVNKLGGRSPLNSPFIIYNFLFVTRPCLVTKRKILSDRDILTGLSIGERTGRGGIVGLKRQSLWVCIPRQSLGTRGKDRGFLPSPLIVLSDLFLSPVSISEDIAKVISSEDTL